MKPALVFALLFVALLLAPAASQAQTQTNSTTPDVSDPVLLSAGKASRGNRFADAEKVLADAIHQLEASAPNSSQLALYQEMYLQVCVDRASREGRTADAEKLASDAVHQAEQADPPSPQLADSLKLLGSVLEQEGKHSDALTLEQHALEIDQAAFGPNDKSVEDDLFEISLMLGAQRKRDEEEQYLKQALEIARLNLDIPDGEKGMVLSTLANVYSNEGRDVEAEQLLLEEKQLCVASPKNTGVCPDAANGLAGVYFREGRTAEADDQVVTDFKSFMPPEVAQLEVQALNYGQNKEYARAEETHRQALAWIESNPQVKGPSSGVSHALEHIWGELGWALGQQGQHDDAESAYAKKIDLELGDAAGTDDKPKDARESSAVFDYIRYDDLMDACRAANRLSDAEPIIQHVLDVQEKLLGGNDPSMTHTLAALADVYQAEGESDKTKYDQALSFYERALYIHQANLDADEPNFDEVLTSYADLLRKLHQDAKATEVQARIEALEK